jgi:hypothetical protein
MTVYDLRRWDCSPSLNVLNNGEGLLRLLGQDSRRSDCTFAIPNQYNGYNLHYLGPFRTVNDSHKCGRAGLKYVIVVEGTSSIIVGFVFQLRGLMFNQILLWVTESCRECLEAGSVWRPGVSGGRECLEAEVSIRGAGSRK